MSDGEAKSYFKLSRQQLITLAIALEDQRDRAIAIAEAAEDHCCCGNCGL